MKFLSCIGYFGLWGHPRFNGKTAKTSLMVLRERFTYVWTVFLSDLYKNYLSISQTFFALFVKFLIPWYFFPDGINVNLRYIYCYALLISRPWKWNVNFLIVAFCLLTNIIFVFLRFNFHLLLYCSNIDIVFFKSSFYSEKIAKLSVNNKLFIFDHLNIVCHL